jgi:hypothetical protein
MTTDRIYAARQELKRIHDRSAYSSPEAISDQLARLSVEFYKISHPHDAVDLGLPEPLPYVPPDEDKPNPTAWPKKCPTCAREFTPVTWPCLRLRGYVGHFQSQGARLAVELRDCICTSTIGIEVPMPMAVTP